MFLHYIFMDNAFELPTGLGLQLQVSSSGIITPGIKAGVKLEVADVRICSLSSRAGVLCNLKRCLQFKTKCVVIGITSLTFLFLTYFLI